MISRLILILFFCLFFLSCSKNNNIEDTNKGVPILSYDAEVSETLNLDTANIVIDPSKEYNYWSQHFLNPYNNLNNISTNASFNEKKKVISGKKGSLNIIQPIFFDNIICNVLSNGIIQCKDLVNDIIKFEIDIKPEGVKKYEVLRGGLAYYNDLLVFVDAYGQIKLFNTIDGSNLWSTNIDYPILSPPLIYRDYIYFVSADNRIFSLNLIDGQIEWSFQTISESKKNLYTASPVVYENTIIVPFSNGELVAFIYDTGQPIWSENLSKISMVSNFDIKDISASPVVSENKIYSLSSNGKLVVNNAINGKRIWSIDMSGYRTPIISGNQIYLINEDGKLICIDRNSSDIYWITDLSKHRKGQNPENLNLWLGPYLINNLIYNISYFGELKVVSPITGEILSSDSIGINGVLTPPAILSKAIYLADENSNVYEFK